MGNTRRYLSPSANLLETNLPSALLNQVKLIRFYFTEYLPSSVRPSDLDSIRNRCVPQAEIGPQIALGKITPATSDLSNLRDFHGTHPDPRSYSVSIAFRPHKFEIYKMIFVLC